MNPAKRTDAGPRTGHEQSTTSLGQAEQIPQSLEAEERVLGAMMIAPKTIDRVRSLLGPRDFYRDAHGMIFAAALRLHDRGVPVEPLTLAEEFRRLGKLTEIGGPARLHEIANLTPASANAPHYAEIIRRCSCERVALTSALKLAGDVRRGQSVEDLIGGFAPRQRQEGPAAPIS